MLLTTTPYVTNDEFRAHPTYLDTDDLRSGSASSTDQDAELTNILLMASRWADNFCGQPLGAHSHRQRLRSRFDRQGMLKVMADNGPVRSVSALGWGLTPTALTTSTAPEYWAEHGTTLVFPGPASGMGAWTGSLQFNAPRPGAEIFTQVDYVAGHVNARVTALAGSGATSLTLSDATGVMPGETYRIWEAGSEEHVTIASTWTPLPAVYPHAAQPATVPLAAPLLHDHTTGASLSGLPEDVHLAVINYTVAQLLRPDTTAEDSFPDAPTGPSTRKDDPRKDGSGLVKEAERILSSGNFRRVR